MSMPKKREIRNIRHLCKPVSYTHLDVYKRQGLHVIFNKIKKVVNNSHLVIIGKGNK